MNMSLIYVTGPSGAGKSTITPLLNERGFEAHDADVELCAWYNRETKKKVEYPKLAKDRLEGWQELHTFQMDEGLISVLYDRAKDTTIFILGNCGNELEIADKYFDKVLCLEIDEETMVKRLLTRTTNNYGKDPDQMAIIKKWYKPIMERYRNYGAIMIDGTQSLDEIVDQILKAV
jgi:adenylate kinase family enzyme